MTQSQVSLADVTSLGDSAIDSRGPPSGPPYSSFHQYVGALSLFCPTSHKSFSGGALPPSPFTAFNIRCW